MSSTTPVPRRILLLNIALIVAWVPLLFVARMLVDDVAAGSPSDHLLDAARLAVIGTLVIVTGVYVFAIVLINKFMTQNLGGVHSRVVRPVVISAIALYTAVGSALFLMQ